MEDEKIEIISENFKCGIPSIEVGTQMNKAGYFIRRNPKNVFAFQLCRIKKNEKQTHYNYKTRSPLHS